MGIKDVKKILEKAYNEEAFQELLINNPDEALRDFTLTDNERSKFKEVSKSQLKAYKSNIDKRISKDSSVSEEEDWWTDSVTD